MDRYRVPLEFAGQFLHVDRAICTHQVCWYIFVLSGHARTEVHYGGPVSVSMSMRLNWMADGYKLEGAGERDKSSFAEPFLLHRSIE